MSRLSIPQLSTLAITLRLSPPPKNITQSRAILKTLQRFGQVTAFKALRFPTSIQTFTPTAHALFANAGSVNAVKTATPLKVDGIEVTVVEDTGRWGGKEHEDYLLRANAVVRKEEGGTGMIGVVRATGGGFGISGRRLGEGMGEVGGVFAKKKEEQ